MRARRPMAAMLATLGVLASGFVVAAAPALAAAPEEPLTSSPATSITAATAVLEGTLNPGVSAMTGWYFAYSPESPCTSAFRAPETPEPEALVIAHPVNEEVTGLQPSKTYKFCLVATNATGETAGNEVSLKTRALAPEVIAASERASAVTPFEESFGAVLNANNQETTYAFEYATKATGQTLEFDHDGRR